MAFINYQEPGNKVEVIIDKDSESEISKSREEKEQLEQDDKEKELDATYSILMDTVPDDEEQRGK